MGRRPRHDLRVRAASLAVPLRALPRRGRDAGLARQQPDADRGADHPHRPARGGQLCDLAALGRWPQDGVLHLRAAARPLSVPGVHRSPRGRGGDAGTDARSRHPRGAPMIVVTTPYVPGHRITDSKGMVFGLVVRSRGIGGNLMAGLRSLGGGEIHEYTSLLEDTRRQALDRLIRNATLTGANAIVSMRFDSSELSGTMSEIVAYGTAVVVEGDASAPAPDPTMVE